MEFLSISFVALNKFIYRGLDICAVQILPIFAFRLRRTVFKLT